MSALWRRRPRVRHGVMDRGLAMKKTCVVAACFALTACGSGNGSTTSTSTPFSTSSATSSAPTTTTPHAPPPPPITATGLLKGTAKPALPVGAPGKIDVVAIGPLEPGGVGDATLPIAVRNNTNSAISNVEITGSARAGGKLVANGNSQGTIPATLKPGHVGLAYIYFEIGGRTPPANARYTFIAQGSAPSIESLSSADLRVIEAERSGQRIVGTAKNTNSKQVDGPYTVQAYCFTSTGKLLSEQGSFASPDGPLAPNGSVTFSIDLYDKRCPTFLVGSTAHFS